MSKFYKPIVMRVGATWVISYPCEGVESLLRRDEKKSVERYLSEFYKWNCLSNLRRFDISILWENEKKIMVDRWEMTELESWGSGALSEAKTYRGFMRKIMAGTSAEFGHIVLGEEAKHRLIVCEGDMQKYLATRPVLPSQITNDMDYYVSS